MSNELQIFNSPVFGQVRVLELSNQPWFVAKDITDRLGYQNGRDAISKHVDDDDKGVAVCDTLGGQQNLSIINESGLYCLVLASKLPDAKKFKKWVTSEVLPSIRKAGMYATDELLDNPDLLIAAATKLKEERAARLLAESKVKELEPKAEFYDSVAGSKDALPIGQAAKVLNMGIGQNNLFKLLREQKILMNDNKPYQEFIDRGYFRTIEQKYTKKGETHIYIKTLVYQKGLDYIRKLIQKAS